MNITKPPSFEGGLSTLCHLKSLFHQIDSYAPQKFETLIFSPHHQFNRMLWLQDKEIKVLNPLNAQAAKLQKAWNQCDLPKLNQWLRGFKTKEKAPCSQSFLNTALVIVNNKPKINLTNLVSSQEMPALEGQYLAFLDHVVVEGSKSFQKKILKRIANLHAFCEGRRQIAAILTKIGTLPSLILTIRSGNNSQFVTNPHGYFIELLEEPVTIVSIVPETGAAKSFYTSKETILFHELQHFLNYLSQKDYSFCSFFAHLYCDLSIYDNMPEEARTILGFPDHWGGLSENSLRKDLQLIPRHGHMSGLNLSNHPIKNLIYALNNNLIGDYEWLFPSLTIQEINSVIDLALVFIKLHFGARDLFAVLEHEINVLIFTSVSELIQLKLPESTFNGHLEVYAVFINKEISGFLTRAILPKKVCNCLAAIYTLKFYLEAKIEQLYDPILGKRPFTSLALPTQEEAVS